MIAAERGIRMKLVAATRRLAAAGAGPGTSGDLSARVDNGYIVTPHALGYDVMHPEDLVFMGHDWTHGGGQRPPSPGWRLHRDLYARHPEALAIVTAHSPFATTLASLNRGIPAFHYEVALAGGSDIRCAAYGTVGTQALSEATLAALEGRRACLLANHGVLAYGTSVEAALELAERVEALARMYWQALQVGEPVLLDEVEMARVAQKFATAGRRLALD